MSLLSTDPRVKKVVADLALRKELPIDEYVSNAQRWLALDVRTGSRASAIPGKRQLLAAYRTKLVHQKTMLLRERQKLAGIREDLRDYLLVKYVNHLNGVKNQATRSALLAEALAPLRVKIRRLDDALEIVEVVLGDYEARAFMFRDVVAALALGERE